MRKLVALIFVFCAFGAAAEEEGIRNFLRIHDQICTGGQQCVSGRAPGEERYWPGAIAGSLLRAGSPPDCWAG